MKSIEFKENLSESYTVIWELCNKQLQNLIKKNIYYETKIHDNPINLIKFIKILMQKSECSKYPFVSITEVLKIVVNMKQKKIRVFYTKQKLLNK